MSQRRIALVTDAEHPDLVPDDRALLPALATLKLQGIAARWDDPSVPWESFDAVVMRSPWDYFVRPREFHAWLDETERHAPAIFNPPKTIRWNADKRYLRDLAQRGVDTIETRFVEPTLSTPTLAELIAQHRWEEAVLKPAVSGGAYQTVRFRAAEAAQHQGLLEQILVRGVTALIQPFVRAVEREGEWSVLFFGRRFSHAVLKRPRPGDFRVQNQFGGSVEAVNPPQEVLKAAERVLEAVEGPLLYARVDALRLGSRVVVVELEVIEPSLFFAQDAQAATRFAQALDEIL